MRRLPDCSESHFDSYTWMISMESFAKGRIDFSSFFLPPHSPSRQEISTAWWRLEIWSSRRQYKFCKTFFIYQTISLLKRVIRACKHLPTSFYFWGPGTHSVFYLLPKRSFLMALNTTALLKGHHSFFPFIFHGPQWQKSLQDKSIPLSLWHFVVVGWLFVFRYFWICSLCLPFRFL